MSEISDLYRRYRTSRKRDSIETASRDDSVLDEVDSVYRQYRQDRDPDFDKSIARVMRVARDKIDAENAVVKIIDKADVLSITPSQQNKRSGLLTTLFNAPGQLLDSLGNSLGNVTASKWTKIALPVCAVALVAVSMIGYIENRQDNDSYDLAFVASNATPVTSTENIEVANALSRYIDASPVVSLGFTSVQNEDQRAFQLGVNSIDLQVATLAKKGLLIDLSNRRMSELLVEGRDGSIIDELTDLRKEPEGDYLATTRLLSVVSTSVETSKRWFHWGRSIKSVFYSSQLALDGGTGEPIRKSLEEFENRFLSMGESHFTAPELKVARKIVSLVDQPEYTTGEYRVIRDSARDLIALTSNSDN